MVSTSDNGDLRFPILIVGMNQVFTVTILCLPCVSRGDVSFSL